MSPIYDRHGLKNDYGLPTDYSPAGMAAWNQGRRAWEAAWDRRYARQSKQATGQPTLTGRYHAAICDAAASAAASALPAGTDVTVCIAGRSLVAYLGGDRCVITVSPSATGGPRATAAWVRQELRAVPAVDHAAAQSLAYLTGPHRPTAVVR